MAYEFTSIYLDDPIVAGRVIDVFMPAQVTRDVAIFLVHGGGWRGGSRTGYHTIMRAFHAEGFICASTDYRLSGVTVFDQITDLRHAYDMFVSMLGRQGRAPRILVHGSSAGAHLAALLAAAGPGDCGESLTYGDCSLTNEWVAPVGACLQSTPATFEPWDDIFPHVWTAMQDIVGTPYQESPGLYRQVSPIEHVSGSTPALFLLEAENEHMFPLAFTIAFVERMKAAGRHAEYKVYTKAEHGFFYDLTRRQQKEAFEDILSFIERLPSHC